MPDPKKSNWDRFDIGSFPRRKEEQPLAVASEHYPITVVHVRDGKPLTAVGARLLGVPWRGADA